MKSNVDLYLNADRTKVVAADDPAAATLLVNADREIPDAEITRLGEGLLSQARALGKDVEQAVEPTETKEVESSPENKAVDAPMHRRGSGAKTSQE